MRKHFQFDRQSMNFSCHTEEKFNQFDILLHTEWDRAVAQGLFTFQIDHHAKRRILDDGNLGYIVELNPGRFEKRRAPYPFERVSTPFDAKKFNFNKIKDEEVLFSLDDDQHTDKYLVIINNSPIRPYHVLLVPDRQLEQPQVLTVDCILFGFRFAVQSAHPFVYVGFNSVCGYASINHLHLHGMYMPDRLFLQTVKCVPFHSASNCYLLDMFDVQAFAFDIRHDDEFETIAKRVCMITDYLTTLNVAHNLTIVKGDSFSSSEQVLRVFLWFRQSIIGAKMFDRCNFACLELSGYMTIKSEEVFNDLTESEVRKDMNGVALPLNEQMRIKEEVKTLLDK